MFLLLAWVKFRTEDCVNGSLIDETKIPHPYVNFTTFLDIYESNLGNPVDPDDRYVPSQRSLTIYNSSRLYINLEGCVNTLRGECRDFLLTNGRDGDNKTAQSRYPCYYNKVRKFILYRIFLPFIFFHPFFSSFRRSISCHGYEIGR